MTNLTNWAKIDKATWDEFRGSSAEELATVYVSLDPSDESDLQRAEAVWELGLHRFIAKNERRTDRSRLFQTFIRQASMEIKAGL